MIFFEISRLIFEVVLFLRLYGMPTRIYERSGYLVRIKPGDQFPI